MNGQGTAWPNVLADLVAKRDALTTVIDMIRTHFVGDVPGEMRRGKPGPKPRRSKKALKRTDGRTEQEPRRKQPRSLPDHTHTARTGEPHASSDVVVARDAAIKARLKKGPATAVVLREALPAEPGMTEDQMVRACSNALTRLRLKKEITQVDDGWALA